MTRTLFKQGVSLSLTKYCFKMAASIIKHYIDLLPRSILSRTFDSSIRGLAFCATYHARNEINLQGKGNRSTCAVSTNYDGDLPPLTIPNKINRSPTAVLETLASTVRNDLNQPLYMSIDDPFLSYTSDSSLRSMLAAYDSGKKAAKVMINMHPENYTHLWDSEALPKTLDMVPGGYIHEGPSDEALLERIQCKKVKDAVDIYKAIKSEGGAVSLSTQEKFLGLLCVYNHEDPSDESDITHFVAPDFDTIQPFPVNTWKKGCLAEEVFQLMSEKTPKAYGHLLRGLATNHDRQGAFDLYNEAKMSGISIDLYTYNKLLSVASLDVESVADIQQFIEVILKDMVSQSVKPDVETFNCVLGNLRRVSRWRGVKEYALSILSEMKACGIEPSLCTWAELVSIFYYHKSHVPRDPELFGDMLEEITKQTFECNNEKDLFFFRQAMKSIASLFPEPKFALKVHEILKSQRNFDFVGHRQLRYGYFKDLFMIVTPIEHTDVVMELYENSVPFLFMPPSEVYKAILGNIEMFDTYHYIPRLCADLEWSNLYASQVAIPLLQAMAKEKQEPELQQQFCDICSSIIEKWKTHKLWRGGPYLDGAVIGDMIIVYLNGGHLDKAQEALELFREKDKLQNANPSQESVGVLIQALIQSQDYASTKNLLTMMSKLDYANVSQLVKETVASFDLSDQERNYLKGLASESSSSDSNSSDSSDSDSD